MANQQLKVQTRVCPVCRTVHDLPLCPANTSCEEITSYKAARLQWLQAYAIAALFVAVLVAWGWACIVGINS